MRRLPFKRREHGVFHFRPYGIRSRKIRRRRSRRMGRTDPAAGQRPELHSRLRPDGSRVGKIEWLAYMLATTKHETARSGRIHEYGGRSYFIRRYGLQTAVGKSLGNNTSEEGRHTQAAGPVQLTGESNYEKTGGALRKQYPELVAEFEGHTGRQFDLAIPPRLCTIPRLAGIIHRCASDARYFIAYSAFSRRTGLSDLASRSRFWILSFLLPPLKASQNR